MRKHIHPDWKNILKRAWSIRFWAVAILLQGIELLIPYYAENLPQGLFSILSLMAMIGGMYARFIIQPKLVKVINEDPRP